MYLALFSSVLLGLNIVLGQDVQSPCPEYFDYRNDNSGLHGLIKLKPTDIKANSESTVVINASFTIAAKLPSNYAGRIELEDLEQAYKGFPIYRVNFPITSPLPKLTTLIVNNNVKCKGLGDTLGPVQQVTTITLGHTIYSYYPRSGRN